MLCPEVWNFSPPPASHRFKSGSFSDDYFICDNIVKTHHFNHLISVVLPSISTVPDDLSSILGVDSDYYKIQNVSASEFVNKEFVEAFVKKGNLTVLSDNSKIDIEDCMCVTCNGQLILNVLRETYVELGLEGIPSSFSSGIPSRYIVTVDLCSPSFTPGKKNYERVRESLQHRLHTFDVLLTWEPQDENVCPSSVASYLDNRGYSVLLCLPTTVQRFEHNVKVPAFPVIKRNSEDGGKEDAESLLEWLGAFLLQTDLISGSVDNYMNSYEPPSPTVTCSDVLVLEWRGFFSGEKVHHFFTHLRRFLDTSSVNPWIGLHVQGFVDSPVSWGKQEHTFFTDGDNHYTLFMQPSRFLSCTVLSSIRRPRRTTKYKI